MQEQRFKLHSFRTHILKRKGEPMIMFLLILLLPMKEYRLDQTYRTRYLNLSTSVTQNRSHITITTMQIWMITNTNNLMLKLR